MPRTSHLDAPAIGGSVGMTRAISRRPACRATWLSLILLTAVSACGARQPTPAEPAPPPSPRVLPASRVIVLETSGPVPGDTSVSFVTGTARTIVLRHGPPENVVFARLSFGPAAFADSGVVVRVDVRPHRGVYGLDVTTNLPLREGVLAFEYPRYFSAPALARQVYGDAAAFERALAIGRILPDERIELLPSERPAPDHLTVTIPSAGTYLVAAPQ